MLHKKSGRPLSLAKTVMVSLYIICGAFLASFVVILYCLAQQSQQLENEEVAFDSIVQDAPSIGIETMQKAVESCFVRPTAIINGVTAEIEPDQTEGLSVLWLNDGEMTITSSEQASLVVMPDTAYSFRLAVSIDQETAENVKVYVRIPEEVVTGEASYVEALVTADNAMPYYTRLALALEPTDTINTDKAGEATSPIGTIALNYSADSAILHSNSLVDGQPLGEELFKSKTGVMLGAQEMNGEIPAGEENLCVISWVINSGTLENAPTDTAKRSAQPTSSWLSEQYASQLENWR